MGESFICFSPSEQHLPGNPNTKVARQEVQELEGRLCSEISSKQTAKFSSIDRNSGCGQSTPLRGPAENWFIKVCIFFKDLLLFQRTGAPHLPIAPALGGSDALFWPLYVLYSHVHIQTHTYIINNKILNVTVVYLYVPSCVLRVACRDQRTTSLPSALVPGLQVCVIAVPDTATHHK